MATLSTNTGAVLEIAPVSKLTLVLAQADVIEPEIPREVHPSYPDEFIENPFDPDYEMAVKTATKRRGELVIACILRHAVKVTGLPSAAFLRRKVEREFGREDAEHALTVLYCLDDIEDYGKVAYMACLTESRVAKHTAALRVTKSNGGVTEPIERAALRNVVNAGISNGTIQIGPEMLVSIVEEYEACLAAGLNWAQWCDGVHDLDFMSMTVALHRITGLKALHSNDAAQEAAKEQSKKKQS